MPFQVSPGVSVSEIDLTTTVPAFTSTEGAFAGVFKWGPVDQPILIDSEQSLVARFGKPTNFNAETFFTAANFLAYGNKLYVSRAANTTAASSIDAAYNALANVGVITQSFDFNIKNRDDFTEREANGTFTSETDVLFAAKYPGVLGNSLKISICDSANQYSSNVDLVANSLIAATANISFVVGSNSAIVAVSNSATGTLSDANTVLVSVLGNLSVGDLVTAGSPSVGVQLMKVTSITAVNSTSSACTTTNFSELVPNGNSTHRFVTINFDSNYSMSLGRTSNTIQRQWEYFNTVDSSPGTSTYVGSFGNTLAKDEVHVVITDHEGEITGTPGTVLEVYEGVSRATDAKLDDGSSNYLRTVINDNSAYVWSIHPRVGAAFANAATIVSSTNNKPLSLNFAGGSDGLAEDTVPPADIIRAYREYTSAEAIDISLVLAGKARGGLNDEQVANWLIDNIAEARKDCVVFISPPRSAAVRKEEPDTQVVNFRNALRSSSYAVLDSAYKYQYDKYNDVYRYVPLNGDTAGLCVRTDEQRDPWFSPAGFNRGQVKNLIKLSYNPNKAQRDVLYKNGVNPVVTFPGQGTVLFGDKTLLAKPSAFDRINVRRLFIVLEKAIATAAKFTLFEFNDEFTRAQFRNLVEPFLRDVQGRRGIYEYRVVCDATNNTSGVIDRNEFVGDIYIKPARSINFIQLNFVAVRTGVEFSEIVGSI